jgi:hypothetical protein
MSATTADDCAHEHWLLGTTVSRCTECGLAVTRYETVADAIAACRAALVAPERPAAGDPDEENRPT